jgi:ATP-dependent DNA helicase RecG
MITLCRAAGLPEPEFRQDGGQFVQTIWRDWLTPAVVSALTLSTRQMEAVRYATTHERITNAEYSARTGLAPKTASRDLDELVEKGIFRRLGESRGTYYVRAAKSDMERTNGTRAAEPK